MRCPTHCAWWIYTWSHIGLSLFLGQPHKAADLLCTIVAFLKKTFFMQIWYPGRPTGRLQTDFVLTLSLSLSLCSGEDSHRRVARESAEESRIEYYSTNALNTVNTTQWIGMDNLRFFVQREFYAQRRGCAQVCWAVPLRILRLQNNDHKTRVAHTCACNIQAVRARIQRIHCIFQNKTHAYCLTFSLCAALDPLRILVIQLSAKNNKTKRKEEEKFLWLFRLD